MARLVQSLIWASIRRAPGLYALWVVAIGLALSGVAMVDIYRQSLVGMVTDQGRQMLGGDVSLSARRLLSPDEEEKFRRALPADAKLVELTETTAMVTAGDQSRLALIRFVPDTYPLIGDLMVEGVSRHGADLVDSAWIDSDLAELLQIHYGDLVQIGEVHTKVGGVISRDSSQTVRFGGFAPHVYIHQRQLGRSGLLQVGSTFTRTLIARLELVGRELHPRLVRELNGLDLQITVPADLEKGSLGILSRALDYLGLIGLVTLLLGWVAIYFLCRRWLAREAEDTPALECLGVTRGELRSFLITKLVIILSSGAIAAGFVAWIAARAAYPWVREYLPPEFTLAFRFPTALLLLGAGPIFGLIFSARDIERVARGGFVGAASMKGFSTWLPAGGGILLFGLLALRQARSFKVAGLFLGTLGAATLLILGTGVVSLIILRRVRPRFRLGYRAHVLSAAWVHRPATTLLLIAVSGVGGLLAQMVPHLQLTLLGDLGATAKTERPALFLYDIQDEQLADLRAKLNHLGAPATEPSPLVRARVLMVNEIAFERRETNSWSTREDESEARFRNRGLNLTYREALDPSEAIVRGKPFSEMSANEVSVEVDYAERLSLKLGDTMRMDVQGAEIEAQIVNLRSINWDSFRPNFFVEMRKLNDTPILEAPKAWVMAVMPSEVRPAQVQRELARQFSNVSSLNVGETLGRFMALVSRLGASLKVAGRLTLALGLFVFAVLALFQLLLAADDWQLLRRQGMTPGELRILQILTFLGPSSLGALAGAVLALGVNFSLAHFALHTAARFAWGESLVTLMLTMIMAVLTLAIGSPLVLGKQK